MPDLHVSMLLVNVVTDPTQATVSQTRPVQHIAGLPIHHVLRVQLPHAGTSIRITAYLQEAVQHRPTITEDRRQHRVRFPMMSTAVQGLPAYHVQPHTAVLGQIIRPGHVLLAELPMELQVDPQAATRGLYPVTDHLLLQVHVRTVRMLPVQEVHRLTRGVIHLQEARARLISGAHHRAEAAVDIVVQEAVDQAVQAEYAPLPDLQDLPQEAVRHPDVAVVTSLWVL